MPDRISKDQRSHIMSCIHSKDTRIEILLRRELWRRGYRYRVHYSLPGKPDIVFIRERVAIFCDGCFWHGCPNCFRPPKSNESYWGPKIRKNRERAKKYNEILQSRGWTVLRFWEHEILDDSSSIILKIEKKLGEIGNGKTWK